MLSFSLLQISHHVPLPPLTKPPHHSSPLSKTLHFSPKQRLPRQFLSKTLRRFLSISNSSVSPSPEDGFEVELDRLLALLPREMRRRVSEHPEHLYLVEVVMDLGRKPLARFPSGDFVLSDCPITLQDLQHATSKVGDFAIDNRAGISRTLHRISAIRNRKGQIIGLTCRVGRAIQGSASLLRDLVQDGASLLFIGPPGVGKTTIIREIARMLANDYKKRVMIVDTSNEIGGDGDIPHPGIGNARRMQVPDSDMQHKVLIEAVENHMPQVIVIDEIGTKLEAMAASTIAQRGIQLVATAHGLTIENLIMNPSLDMLVGGIQFCREIARMLANDYKKRVMIVDTSNEIGGDGDIPHPGIGNARRMQVPDSDMQHKVLIEAVENHMPQVIVIDEIGTKLEAMAASTIAQRGIQLVATAHGLTIENLIMNPSLDMLVGGIQSVTLGDEEANRRGVQKTVLERKGPSTFSCGVEIISKTELRVHHSLEATVDAILSGRSPYAEVCKMISPGVKKEVESEPAFQTSSEKKDEVSVDDFHLTDERNSHNELTSESLLDMGDNSLEHEAPLCLYVYGILETSVIQGINQLKMDAEVQLTDNISDADALLALQSKLKKNAKIQAAAKSHDIPIYVTKTSSLEQITKAIRALMNSHANGLKGYRTEENTKLSEKIDALEEARIAVMQVVIPKGEPVELLPRSSHIMSLQIDFIQKYQLETERIGTEPEARLRILPYQTRFDANSKFIETVGTDSGVDNFLSATGDTNGSPFSTDRLPLLPD